MKTIEHVQNKFEMYFERIAENLEKISLRERILVVFTSIFVVVALLGSALWYMHVAAEKQQHRVDELKDLVMWMQSNVVTMKPVDNLGMTLSEKIQRAAQQQGLPGSTQQVGDKMQVMAQHENYAILANFLTQLAQMGVSIEKMELTKVDGQIKLTATVQ